MSELKPPPQEQISKVLDTVLSEPLWKSQSGMTIEQLKARPEYRWLVDDHGQELVDAEIERRAPAIRALQGTPGGADHA